MDAPGIGQQTGGLAAVRAGVLRQADGEGPLDYDSLCALAGTGRRQLDRRFRETFLCTPGALFREARAARAERLLRDGHDVLNAAVRAGYSGPGRLHDAMVRERGLTPGEVRVRGRGVAVRFGFFDTPLGIVLMAATARGLCALHLCAAVGAAKCLEMMRSDFANADLREDPGALQRCADQLVDWLDDRVPHFRPDLDLMGTDFQQAVWRELRRIPPGGSVTYRELARRAGRPSATRAAANACASNRVAIVVPCHRAIRSDGSLAGYRWGAEWKRRLLETESRGKS